MAADLYSVATGGVIGVLGGFLSNYAIEQFKSKKAAKHLAQSFLGEIKALRTITEARGYTDGLKQLIEHIEITNEPILYQVKVRKDYLVVYKENADRIGMLEEPLPEYLATFYTLTNSILEDLESLSDGTFTNRPPQSLIKCYKEMLILFEKAGACGDKIIEIITEKYSEPM